MEMSFSDEMYRGLGGSHCDSPVVHDENSVDIYSGLDSSPGNGEHTDKVNTHISPGKLKDSMDLYEEIIKEEQQEREASYNELKTKLDAAENKVKELLCKLQQVQEKNTTLHTENIRLKKNICALIKTAKMEILRKDEEISRLNQRFGCGPPRTQHYAQRRQSTRLDPSGTCASSAVVQMQEPKVTFPSKELHEHHSEDRNSFVQHPSLSCIDSSPVTATPLHKGRCIRTHPETRMLLPVSREEPAQSGKVCTGSTDRQQNSTVMQEEVSQNVKDGKQQATTRKDQLNHIEFGGNEQKQKDQEELNRDHKELAKDCTEPNRSNRQHPASNLPGKLERSNSPSHQKKWSPTSDALHRTSCGSHSTNERHKDSREKRQRSSSQERRYGKDRHMGDRSVPGPKCKDGKRSSSNHGSCESGARHSSSHRGQRSPTWDLQKKERWRREEENRSRLERSSKAEKRDEYERRKWKESSKSGKDRHGKTDGDKKVRESASRGSLRDEKRNTPCNEHSTGTESFSSSRKDSAEGLTSLNEKDHGKRSGTLEADVVEHETDKEKVSEVNCQNKKLSFMETLNLTLSPVKKPRLCSEGKEAEDRTPRDLQEGQEEYDQYDFGEDYCVIDEVNSSHEFLQEEHKINKISAVSHPVNHVSGNAKEPKQQCDVKKCGKEGEQDRVSSNGTSIAEKPMSESVILNHSEDTVVQSRECKQSNVLESQGSKPAAAAQTAHQTDCSSVAEIRDADSALKIIPSIVMVENGAREHLLNSVVQVNEVRNGNDVSGLESDTGLSVCETPHAESSLTVTEDDAGCVGVSVDNTSDNCGKQNNPLPVQSEESHGVCASVAVERSTDHRVSRKETCDTSADDVSSTVNIEMLSECCDKPINTSEAAETVVISTTESESNAEKTDLCDSQLKESPMEVPESASSSVLSPKNCSEPDSTKDEERNPVPSSSVLLYQDEDSMMLTLKNIRLIPNAISPLTSPVRPVKSQPLSSGKAPHVKSLSKDFSNVAVRMDVNKENEKPDCSATQRPQKDQAPSVALSSSSSSEDENELEEGEIVSDSEDDSNPAPLSPPQNRGSLSMAGKHQSRPRSPAKRQVQKMPVVSQGNSGTGTKSAGTPTKSPLSKKRRFKTIMPLLPKASPSTVHEAMEMFKVIRSLMRKKYMKLHKTFPKKSFYNIIDMSLFSFTDFVNNANFSKLCGRENNPKPKLNNIISVWMKKISNNGIVKRIFEQQAPSLKKKLWTFVEGQFDFLFKEIKMAFTNLCKPAEARPSSKTESKFGRSREKKEVSPAKSSVTLVPEPNKKAEQAPSKAQGKTVVPSVVPYRTGLGSRGKNLRIAMEQNDKVPEDKKQDLPLACSQSGVTPTKSDSITEKSCLRPFHNTSLPDKSDFEILTEQQASSLTFNLVTDSQMGEIFKCLLQGSDLLENSVSMGDVANWPVSTPRKDVQFGESYVGVTSPNKIMTTPSKLVTAWSAISPCKFTSPNSKIRIPLSPAVFDESCMLEVPSSLSVGRNTSSSATVSQRSYSILAEDLAVSLTIPSPLKSDNHLSFLNPVGEEYISAPESIISAHFSEDALLDGEDATEQDIHLALDSDNSSSESTGGDSREADAVPQTFQFKPHVPMQAVVMEKSNDHFIVRIRHTSPSAASSPTSTDGTRGPSTPKAAQDVVSNDDNRKESQTQTVCSSIDVERFDQDNLCDTSGEHLSQVAEKDPKGNSMEELMVSQDKTTPKTNQSTLTEFKAKDGSVKKKRKKRHPEQTTKKARTEVLHEQTKKKSKKKIETIFSPKEMYNSVSSPESANSLSAENVVRRKGEVVVTWTREEDRHILIELKTSGASPETFSNLSAKLKKSPSQIADRFSQLMKLFKKKERMNC
ncbi:CASP8-associated protein 2 [Scleropages formosus]|uniref:CASP8-associated protein 2 n=1 Tax=Scleropages formosus TaxID=113540 RepID=UPI0010FA6F61|nr:CASP8-associated protein 2 [Scleropages formosus]